MFEPQTQLEQMLWKENKHVLGCLMMIMH